MCIHAVPGAVLRQLDTIDMRALQGTIAQYIVESKPDIVLFLYNTSALPGAANFQ